MEFNEILRQVNEIFIDVLENDSIKIQPSTTAEDIPEWDSLNHIALVVSIEKHFKVHFTSHEIQEFKNVGEMVEGIERKLQAK
jgi:acyl carrier protein